jgi:hypothetical protein
MSTRELWRKAGETLPRWYGTASAWFQRPAVLWLVRLALISALIAIVIRSLSGFQANDLRVDPQFLPAMLLVYVGAFCCGLGAWLGVVSTLDRVQLLREMRAFAYTIILRRIPMVASAWQYVGRAAMYEQLRMRARHAFSLSIVDLFSQFSSVVLVLTGAYLLAPADWHGGLPIGLIVAICVALIIGLWAAVLLTSRFRTMLRGMLIASGCYSVGWLAAAIILKLVMASLPVAPAVSPGATLGILMLSVLLGYVVKVVPVPLQGISEVSLAYLFIVQYGQGAGLAAVAFSLVWFFSDVAFGSIALAGIQLLQRREATT